MSLFAKPPPQDGALIVHGRMAYKTFNKYVCLNQIMRQKGSDSGQINIRGLLSRLRDVEKTSDDHLLLLNRVKNNLAQSFKSDYVIHIFSTK